MVVVIMGLHAAIVYSTTVPQSEGGDVNQQLAEAERRAEETKVLLQEVEHERWAGHFLSSLIPEPPPSLSCYILLPSGTS